MLTPDDDDLLQDLLDGRLQGGEAERARARLEREPHLREAYDDLLRARDMLRALPAAEPPGDFTARLRARLDAEGALEVHAGAHAAPAGPLRDARAAPSAAPAIPPAWRRLVLIAYGMAAVLVVAIGLLSLQRGAQREAPAIESASGPPAASRDAGEGQGPTGSDEPAARRGRVGGVEGVAEAKDKARDDEAGREAPALLPPSASAGLPGQPPAESGARKLEDEASEDRAREAPAGAKEAAPRGTPRLPRLGAGGAVQPGLRAPSDAAAPPAEPAPTPAPTGVAPGAPLQARAPTPAVASPVAPPAPSVLADLLLLEAESAEEGRRLLDQALAGPRADAKGTDPDAGGKKADAFTEVRLRRAEVVADRALLVRLGVVGVSPERGGTGRPPAAAGGGGGESTAPVTVLADFSRALNAEQQARLDALLGPLPTGATGGALPAPAPAAPAAPPPPTTPPAAAGAAPARAPATRATRLVRFVVLAPSAPR